ncbi:unnamed protein product [Phytophthora fragariaefolia]|uniref:Unnamed protein product n=1 Tax=Phytophthora fragariaefolia TaxID=1490495 RepID=A0A9W6UEH6_9STRA|nr:unnamed protein product [Phytophthora fragariaefolia]
MDLDFFCSGSNTGMRLLCVSVTTPAANPRGAACGHLGSAAAWIDGVVGVRVGDRARVQVRGHGRAAGDHGRVGFAAAVGVEPRHAARAERAEPEAAVRHGGRVPGLGAAAPAAGRGQALRRGAGRHGGAAALDGHVPERLLALRAGLLRRLERGPAQHGQLRQAHGGGERCTSGLVSGSRGAQQVVNGPRVVMEYDTATAGLLEEEPHNDAESTISEHIVFSGERFVCTTNHSHARVLTLCMPWTSSYFLPYLLAALFSVHSLIAGFALGVNHSMNRTAVATTVAIFSHKVPHRLAITLKWRVSVQRANTLAYVIVAAVHRGHVGGRQLRQGQEQHRAPAVGGRTDALQLHDAARHLPRHGAVRFSEGQQRAGHGGCGTRRGVRQLHLPGVPRALGGEREPRERRRREARALLHGHGQHGGAGRVGIAAAHCIRTPRAASKESPSGLERVVSNDAITQRA